MSLCTLKHVRAGRQQSLIVAASIPFSLTLRASRGSWSSIGLPKEYALRPNQVLDVGTLRSEPAVQVSIRVVDRAGNPVEGMRIGVRYDKPFYGIGKKRTDPDGRSTFYVNAHSEGVISAFTDYDHIKKASSNRFHTDTLKDGNSDIVIVWDE